METPPQDPEYQFVTPYAPSAVSIVLPPSQTEVSDVIIEVGAGGYQPNRVFGLVLVEVATVVVFVQIPVVLALR